VTNEVIKNHAITGIVLEKNKEGIEGISDKYSRSRKQEEKKKKNGLVPKSRDGRKKERKSESRSQSYTIFFSSKSPCLANLFSCIHSIHRDFIPCFSDALFLWIREFIIHSYPSFNAESCESNPPLNQEKRHKQGDIPVLSCIF